MELLLHFVRNAKRTKTLQWLHSSYSHSSWFVGKFGWRRKCFFHSNAMYKCSETTSFVFFVNHSRYLKRRILCQASKMNRQMIKLSNLSASQNFITLEKKMKKLFLDLNFQTHQLAWVLVWQSQVTVENFLSCFALKNRK